MMEGEGLKRAPDAETQAEALAREESAGMPMYQLVFMAVISLVVSATVWVAGYMISGSLSGPKVAVVDLAGVVELEQMRMTAVVMKPESTEEERMKAFGRVKDFGPMLEKAIEELNHECGCVILSRNAVVGTAHRDFTEELKRKLGLEGIDLEAAKGSAQRSLSRRVPSAEDLAQTAKEARR